MATDARYAAYICDQLARAGGITVKKMFGEYALYRHGKVVALIADNQLFVKPTPAGEALLETPTWGPPYPGAKPFLNVSDLLDDAPLLIALILTTDAALPAAKKKGAKKATKRAVKKVAKKAAKKVKKQATKKIAKKATKKALKKVPRKPAKKTARNAR